MARKEAVKGIFDDIAPSYDRLNHFLSFDVDKRWRRKAIRSLDAAGKQLLLDVACGTGDFSIAAARAGVKQVIGIDISEKMLEIGREKVKACGLEERVRLCCGDSERMEFPDDSFDAVTVAFGVRNFEHLEAGLKEMYRVLKPGGQVVVLEFSMPRHFPVRQLYRFYFRRILPVVGGWVSGNKGAYVYLPESVFRFPQGTDFLRILEECGFRRTAHRKLTFGIAGLYTGYKTAPSGAERT